MQNGNTNTAGVDAAPTEPEARSLLEKRKEAPVPSHVERGEPAVKRKKTTAKRKAKSPQTEVKKKAKPAPPVRPVDPVEVEDESSSNSSPQESATAESAVPLAEKRPATAQKEGGSSRPKTKPTAEDKGKQVAESGGTPPYSYEKVYQRRIRPHRDDVAFVELDRADLTARINRASRNLVSERDMEYLNSLPPVERAEQARASAVDVSFPTRLCLMF